MCVLQGSYIHFNGFILLSYCGVTPKTSDGACSFDIFTNNIFIFRTHSTKKPSWGIREIVATKTANWTSKGFLFRHVFDFGILKVIFCTNFSSLYIIFSSSKKLSNFFRDQWKATPATKTCSIWVKENMAPSLPFFKSFVLVKSVFFPSSSFFLNATHKKILFETRSKVDFIFIFLVLKRTDLFCFSFFEIFAERRLSMKQHFSS